MTRLTAPEGKKLRNIKTEALYSEVVTSHPEHYVLADSEDDPIITILDGVTLGDRVSDLEDAVVELAEIITEG